MAKQKSKVRNEHGGPFAGNVVCHLGVGDPLLGDRVTVQQDDILVSLKEPGMDYYLNRKTGEVKTFRRNLA